MKVKLLKVKCCVCGYEWTPRASDIRKCSNPKCRSMLWDKPERLNQYGRNNKTK